MLELFQTGTEREKMRMIVQMSSKSKIYHRPGCQYLNRIKEGYLTLVELQKKTAGKLSPCKCCCKLSKMYRDYEPAMKKILEEVDGLAKLEENQIKTVLGESKWTTTAIKGILTNEKYCGDVLLQKTFRTDVISKKVIKNVGQMAQYYMPDHHEAIVSREQYNAVKAEMARRSALRSPSKTAVTGRSCYTSKYALSDRLVCGECGTLYRRCTWTSLGRKYPVWRCTSRLNYGTKYCHDSPTIKEEPLQAAILAAINSAMSNKPALLDLIKNAVSLELLPVQGQTMSLADIESRLVQLDEQFQRLLAEAIDAEDKEVCNAQFAEILAEQTALKKQKEEILQSNTDADRVCTRMKQAEQALEATAPTITEWNENAVRQIVERVTVLSADEVLVRIKSGAEIKQTINR